MRKKYIVRSSWGDGGSRLVFAVRYDVRIKELMVACPFRISEGVNKTLEVFGIDIENAIRENRLGWRLVRVWRVDDGVWRRGIKKLRREGWKLEKVTSFRRFSR